MIPRLAEWGLSVTSAPALWSFPVAIKHVIRLEHYYLVIKHEITSWHRHGYGFVTAESSVNANWWLVPGEMPLCLTFSGIGKCELFLIGDEHVLQGFYISTGYKMINQIQIPLAYICRSKPVW